MVDALQDMMAYHQRSRHYPGALAWVERQGKVLARPVSGRLHGDDGATTPMAPDAVFRIASLSKPLVSLLALMLVEQGLVELDTPVGEVLPELAGLSMADGRAPGRALSLRDCLRHTVGLPYAPDIRDPAARQRADDLGLNRSVLLSRAEFLAALAALPLAAGPGTRFQYGYGTDLAGLMAERITGRSLADALQQRVLGPLQMKDTGFRRPPDSHAVMPRAFPEDAAWHRFVDQACEADRRHAAGDDLLPSGGGGLTSTLDDYLRFARMLANGGVLPDGTPLLGADLFARMMSDQLGPQVDGPYGFTGGGFGFGLAGAIRLPFGAAATPARAGEFTWSGVTGHTLYIDPTSGWFALMLSSNTASRLAVRLEFRRAAARASA